jgi:hypothetical protein
MKGAHAKRVNERAADEDRNRKRPERRAEDQPHLLVRDMKGGAHRRRDIAPNGEHHRRRDERHTAGEKEFLLVHGETTRVYPSASLQY